MNKVDKIDFMLQDKQLYSVKSEPELVRVPAMKYLMYDGFGAPETNPAFQQAMQALYGVAYAIKFLSKKAPLPRGYKDFKVPPPEGLWWMKNGGRFDTKKPHDWRWTLMLRVPDFVTHDLVQQIATELVNKKNDEVYANVYLEEFREGLSVQLMHVGPYDGEAADIAKMDAYVEEGGYSYRGKHHEIYFGDPRRTRPENLRTILRHPVVAHKLGATQLAVGLVFYFMADYLF